MDISPRWPSLLPALLNHHTLLLCLPSHFNSRSSKQSNLSFNQSLITYLTISPNTIQEAKLRNPNTTLKVIMPRKKESTQTPFPLLSLPLELRILIRKLVVVEDELVWVRNHHRQEVAHSLPPKFLRSGNPTHLSDHSRCKKSVYRGLAGHRIFQKHQILHH